MRSIQENTAGDVYFFKYDLPSQEEWRRYVEVSADGIREKKYEKAENKNQSKYGGKRIKRKE
jgi:hypothetical protein